MNKFLLFILLITVPFLVFVHFRGFIHHDEGWALQSAYRMYQGDVAYKDFQFAYNPGVLFVNLFSFIFFDPSIFSSRLLALTNSIISVIFLYLIAKKVELNKLSTALIIFIYVSWGPGHINFVWPVMFCLTLAVINIYLYLFKINSKILFLAGVVSALTFIFKQNFGLAILLANLIYLLSKRENILIYFLGYLIGLLPAVFYLTISNSLQSFVDNFYYLTIVKIGREGMLNSPFPWQYPENPIYKILKTVFYLSPLLLSLFVIKKGRLFVGLICGLFYSLSIRPTTDYIHLSPLLALTSLPLVLSKQKLLTVFFGAILLVLGLYSSIFSNYYRWDPALIKQNFTNINQRTKILADKNSTENINQITRYFSDNPVSNEYIFVYNFSPIYYFLLNKKNPTKYDYIGDGYLSKNEEEEIISEIKNKKVKQIITIKNTAFEKTQIFIYIANNFSPALITGDFTIWEQI